MENANRQAIASSVELPAVLNLLTADQLLTYKWNGKQPLLVTQLQRPTHLSQLSDWLLAQSFETIPITLFALPEGPTRVCLADQLMTESSPLSFPLQAYIPPLPAPQVTALQTLGEVVAQLRHPKDGCPWDLAQTPETLIPYILEEAYETVDAIRQGKPQAIAEELGDLLLQVFLQSQIASETQQFTLADVAQGIAQKLIRRHPHIFGNLQVKSIEDVHATWDAIKASEKGESEATPPLVSQKLERYARRLPPLMAALKLSEKAAAAGFEWPNVEGVWAKFYEELAEFQEALLQGNLADQAAELGDLFFTLVNIARWCQIDPADALHQTNLKLIERIQVIESKADKPLTDHTPEELEALWQTAKHQLKPPVSPTLSVE